MKNSEMTLEQIEKRRASQRIEGYKIKKRIRDKRYSEANKEKLCKRCGINKRGRVSIQICDECRKKELAEKGIILRKRLSPEEAKRRNKESRKKYKKDSWNKNDLWINEYKKDKCCVSCGWNQSPEILQFHHIGNKKENVSNLKKKSLERIKEEIKNCILLCPNCHFLLHSKMKK